MVTHETAVAGHKVHRYQLEAMETATGLHHKKLLMWAFLASDCMFFGSLITTYLVYKGTSRVGPYPPDVFNIPFTSISTFCLLMSSLMMVLALAAVQRNDIRGMQIWLIATALLGSLFLGGQVYEFTSFVREGLKLSVNQFGTTFFFLTGFHGAHVTVGVIWLMSLFGASLKGHVTDEDGLNVDIAALYWHFVDIVWIIIFTVVYLID